MLLRWYVQIVFPSIFKTEVQTCRELRVTVHINVNGQLQMEKKKNNKKRNILLQCALFYIYKISKYLKAIKAPDSIDDWVKVQG